MHCLLNLIHKLLPVASAEWEAISVLYNATKEPQWKARNGPSLKRKFRSMCIASKQACTTLASATRWVQYGDDGEASRRLWLDVPPQAVIRVVPRTRWWAATVVNGAMRRVTVKFR
ncbi:hypothetical protein PC123_g23639 [Phytophthora cactorum]|nr:hypothetical protein PC123_g23639 [Phytophthora cactorum]